MTPTDWPSFWLGAAYATCIAPAVVLGGGLAVLLYREWRQRRPREALNGAGVHKLFATKDSHE